MEKSKIGWLNGGNTFNPWIGCSPVSEACRNCYAKRETSRFKITPCFNTYRKPTGVRYWARPLAWDRASNPATPTLVFCGSLCDVFEDRADLEAPRRMLGTLIEQTPNLLWLLLTKRPENAERMRREMWGLYNDWPENVWLGCTAENQETWHRRIPHLLSVPAAGRFVSCEPLLGHIEIASFREHKHTLDWVIAGGESGPHARETTSFWFEEICDSCRAWRIPFFFKQHGAAFSKRLKAAGDSFSSVKQFPAAFGIKEQA